MTKILIRTAEIDNCGDCDNHCRCCCDATPDTARGTPYKVIPECPNIPDWCPLPDKQIPANFSGINTVGYEGN